MDHSKAPQTFKKFKYFLSLEKDCLNANGKDWILISFLPGTDQPAGSYGQTDRRYVQGTGGISNGSKIKIIRHISGSDSGTSEKKILHP